MAASWITSEKIIISFDLWIHFVTLCSVILNTHIFLLLVRYLPKEELWYQCKKYENWRPTSDRWPMTTNLSPQGHFTHFAKISNGHNAALQRVNPSCLFLGWGFRGQWIERRHFQLDQIKDGGRRPSWKTSNGQISETHYPIHCVYVYRPCFAVGLKIYNDGDSKLISLGPGRVTSRPTV